MPFWKGGLGQSGRPRGFWRWLADTDERRAVPAYDRLMVGLLGLAIMVPLAVSAPTWPERTLAVFVMVMFPVGPVVAGLFEDWRDWRNGLWQ